ncbi:MAG: CRISPR-associated endonuclease Cas2 [Firmicutes bacterium]|nr:CRISPR-associated endonuclease Cas2 [Bacillota bacterium]
MNVVVSYDITDDRRRNKLAKVLKDYGTRVQYSVFEVVVDGGRFEKMRRAIEKVINESEDSVRFYILCAACLGRIICLGKGEEFSREEDYYII